MIQTDPIAFFPSIPLDSTEKLWEWHIPSDRLFFSKGTRLAFGLSDGESPATMAAFFEHIPGLASEVGEGVGKIVADGSACDNEDLGIVVMRSDFMEKHPKVAEGYLRSRIAHALFYGGIVRCPE